MNPRGPLSVLNVAYPLAPVGADSVGGAEQVLTHLDSALAQAGHRSFVIACEGSTAAGVVLTIPREKGPINQRVRFELWDAFRKTIGLALQRWPIDLVHFHGVDFYEYLPSPGVPVLITLHLPPGWYPPHIFQLPRPSTWLICVSATQHEVCPPCSNLLPPIENGVSSEFSKHHYGKREFALGLGRICQEKGFHIALEAAALAATPLLLAGQLFPYPAHEEYFRKQILPRLGRWGRFVGPVGFERKRRFLAAARCLVVPSLAPETSSLAAMEALACGTPVIAFPAGALPDIVEHGKTGFLVHNVQEMAEAMAAVGSLDPALCRATAQRRFSLDAMIERYFDVYKRLAAEGGQGMARRTG